MLARKKDIFSVALSMMLFILGIFSQYTNIVLFSLDYNHIYFTNAAISEKFIETFNDVCTNELIGSQFVQTMKSDVSTDNGAVIRLQVYHIFSAILPKEFHALVYNSFRKQVYDVTFLSVIIYYIHNQDGRKIDLLLFYI